MGAYGALDLLSRCPHAFSATVAIAGAPYISLHLPTSPYISLYLPVSPCISLYLPVSPPSRSPVRATPPNPNPSPNPNPNTNPNPNPNTNTNPNQVLTRMNGVLVRLNERMAAAAEGRRPLVVMYGHSMCGAALSILTGNGKQVDLPYP